MAGALARASAIETPTREDVAYEDASLVGKPGVEPGGMAFKVRHGRLCSLLLQRLLAPGPYGVREIGSEPKLRALSPSPATDMEGPSVKSRSSYWLQLVVSFEMAAGVG